MLSPSVSVSLRLTGEDTAVGRTANCQEVGRVLPRQHEAFGEFRLGYID